MITYRYISLSGQYPAKYIWRIDENSIYMTTDPLLLNITNIVLHKGEKGHFGTFYRNYKFIDHLKVYFRIQQ